MTTDQVAVCSYARADALAARTLPLLLGRGVPPQLVQLYVPDHPQLAAYQALAAAHGLPEPQLVPLGLHHARRAVLQRTPPGTRLLWCDDDLDDLVQLGPDGKLHPVPDVLGLAEHGWQATTTLGVHLWGLAPVANAFYLEPGVSAGLCFAIGSCYGTVVPAQPTVLATTHAEKEDYERTLRAWEHDGAVVRLRWAAPRSTYYRGAGGMVADRTVDAQEAAVAYLLERWPGLVRRNPKRRSPYPEVLLSRRKARR